MAMPIRGHTKAASAPSKQIDMKSAGGARNPLATKLLIEDPALVPLRGELETPVEWDAHVRAVGTVINAPVSTSPGRVAGCVPAQAQAGLEMVGFRNITPMLISVARRVSARLPRERPDVPFPAWSGEKAGTRGVRRITRPALCWNVDPPYRWFVAARVALSSFCRRSAACLSIAAHNKTRRMFHRDHSQHTLRTGVSGPPPSAGTVFTIPSRDLLAFCLSAKARSIPTSPPNPARTAPCISTSRPL